MKPLADILIDSDYNPLLREEAQKVFKSLVFDYGYSELLNGDGCDNLFDDIFDIVGIDKHPCSYCPLSLDEGTCLDGRYKEFMTIDEYPELYI